MHRTSPSSLSLLTATVVAASLLLAGCAAELTIGGPADPEGNIDSTGQGTTPDQPAPSEPQGAAGTGGITISMAGQSFSFDADLCLITEEDLLVGGPGRDDDSREPAYLDIDLTTVSGLKTGEVRITLGTDQRFVSTDEDLIAFVGEGYEYLLMHHDNGFQLEGEFRSSTTSMLIGPGTVMVDCG